MSDGLAYRNAVSLECAQQCLVSFSYLAQMSPKKGETAITNHSMLLLI